MTAANQGPYKAENRGSYWVVVDTRNERLASYPTSKRRATAEANYLNETYTKLLAEETRS